MRERLSRNPYVFRQVIWARAGVRWWKNRLTRGQRSAIVLGGVIASAALTFAVQDLWVLCWGVPVIPFIADGLYNHLGRTAATRSLELLATRDPWHNACRKFRSRLWPCFAIWFICVIFTAVHMWGNEMLRRDPDLQYGVGVAILTSCSMFTLILAIEIATDFRNLSALNAMLVLFGATAMTWCAYRGISQYSIHTLNAIKADRNFIHAFHLWYLQTNGMYVSLIILNLLATWAALRWAAKGPAYPPSLDPFVEHTAKWCPFRVPGFALTMTSLRPPGVVTGARPRWMQRLDEGLRPYFRGPISHAVLHGSVRRHPRWPVGGSLVPAVTLLIGLVASSLCPAALEIGVLVALSMCALRAFARTGVMHNAEVFQSTRQLVVLAATPPQLAYRDRLRAAIYATCGDWLFTAPLWLAILWLHPAVVLFAPILPAASIFAIVCGLRMASRPPVALTFRDVMKALCTIATASLLGAYFNDAISVALTWLNPYVNPITILEELRQTGGTAGLLGRLLLLLGALTASGACMARDTLIGLHRQARFLYETPVSCQPGAAGGDRARPILGARRH